MAPSSSDNQRSFVDKCIKDNDGNIVLGQLPNLPIIGWLTCSIIGLTALPTPLLNGFSWLSTAFLFTWAYLELTSGVNYLRRLLGAVMLFILIVPKFY